MDVENLLKKQKNPAQPAKENVPTEQASSVPIASETAIDANNGKDRSREKTVVQPEPKPLTTQERIDRIEQQLTQANQNFQEISVFLGKMEPLIQLSEQIKQQQANPQTAPVSPAPQGGLDIASIMQTAKELGITGGGGQNSVLEEYGRQYMDLSGFVVKEVFKNIVPEAVTRMEAAAAARIAAKASA
jgi:hypothetical protein